MSIQSEIDRIEQNVADTYSVLAAAGAPMPASMDSDNLAGTAANIAAVLYNKAQSLTNNQQAQGRNNINAITGSDLTLAIGVDGLLYIFAKGVQVGTGIEIAPAGDIIGYVDANNNIVLKGNLADGTYSIKYELEDGSTVDIGNLVLDSNTYYSITKNLTNCTINNSATEVVEGGSYSATITANSGYELSSVSVTMGGSAVTVTNGVINIDSVTGNIVITAVAEEASGYTNLADPTSADWQEGYRLSISSGGTSVLAGHTTTNYIPCEAGDVLRIEGLNIIGTLTTNGSGSQNDAKIVGYRADKSLLVGAYGGRSNTSSSYNYYDTSVSVSGNISTYTIMLNDQGEQLATSELAYIRIDGTLMNGYTKNDVIITINEEIA